MEKRKNISPPGNRSTDPRLPSPRTLVPSQFYLMNARQFLQEELLSRIRKDSCKNDPLSFIISACPPLCM